MKYRISHRTHYEYARPVGSSHQSLHLTPRLFARQSVSNTDLRITPEPQDLEERTDYFGNRVTDFVIRDRHEALTIEAESTVVVDSPEDVLLDLSPAWEQAASLVHTPITAAAKDAACFCFPFSAWHRPIPS